MPTAAEDYSATAIEVLSGLEPVRMRPGMYTDTTAPNHLLQEVVDNSVDEALAGHASKIDVTVRIDGSIEVIDDGRGMPVDVHPEHDLTGVELILTKLHAGGKFSGDHYQYAGGLHGVGVSVVNALSKELDVFIKRGGVEYHQSFAGGEPKSKLQEIGKVAVRSTGTRLRFVPDEQYFEQPNLRLTRLRNALRAKAILCSGLRVTLTVEALNKPSESTTWQFGEGVRGYLLEQMHAECIPTEPFVAATRREGEECEFAVTWDPTDESVTAESFVNLIPTPQGGSHITGLRAGLSAAIKEFCEFRNLLPRKLQFNNDDVWERCSFVLSAKTKNPQFSGQTKERLSSTTCGSFISSTSKDAFSLWLNEHPKFGEAIAELIFERARARIQRGKKVARKKFTSGPALPGKLADCASDDILSSELFLVEGDSAGGSAKQARSREFQAVLPLRGKIKNTWDVSTQSVLDSETVHDISVAIGVEPGASDLSKLRYHKICILADADSDGAHIATLLCALFYKHFRTLIDQGHLYLALPPLFRVDIGHEKHYAADDVELNEVLASLKKDKPNGKPQVLRFKGLGEMSALQLRETAMAPDTRNLVQLQIDGDGETHAILDMMLAKRRAQDRKSWLTAKGDQATAIL